MNLVYSTPDRYDFYAFCDQDDIWIDTKLERAISVLNKTDKRVYCSNQTLINADGVVKGLRYKESINLNLIDEIQENKVIGCTIVFNNSFKQMICEKNRRLSDDFINHQIHDIWFGWVCYANYSL